MIFESLWPLFLLAAVPIIIILYLLKPKGEDHRISSNLLWQKILKNQQSKTFFEKFIHNILMYVQILIVLLLVLALMSPFIHVKGQGGGRKVILLDTSASMQHIGENGVMRLEEAINSIEDYVKNAPETSFSLISVDATGAKLHAVDLQDKSSLVQVLNQLNCIDGGGDLTMAQSLLDTLVAEEDAELMVYTDGAGASSFDNLRFNGEKELYVCGGPVSNVANEYTVCTLREDGLYDVMVSLKNYSGQNVSFDVSLMGEAGMLGLTTKTLSASERTFCLFEGVTGEGETFTSQISAITFANNEKDSLEADNVSYALVAQANVMKGLLVSDGNTFLEKAYMAVAGENIVKSQSDTLAGENYINMVIYDYNQKPENNLINRLIFGDGQGKSIDTLSNVVLNMKDCDLTTGLSDFVIGVNKAYCFSQPEGAKSFLEYDGKCVGYYREINGIKEIVVGFDIRESDFPLRAEFPVFLANAMIYLTNTSWLATNEYYAGENLAIQPWADISAEAGDYTLSKKGIYTIGNEEYEEPYVVRFATATESDGQVEAQSLVGNNSLQLQQVKRTLRNILLVAALGLLVLEWCLYVRQMRYKGKFYLVIRGVVFVLVLLALMGLKISMGKSQNATIFLVDVSGSNEENIVYAEQYLKDTIANMPDGNAYGVITFGKEALAEQFVTEEKYFAGLMTTPDNTATNFEEALSKALTMIPADMSGRLVVLTDGKETRGDIQRMAHALTAGQVPFYTVLYESIAKEDAYVDSVKLPSYLHPGDKYSINVVVESNYATDALITVYNGSRAISSSQVRLNKGSNHFVFDNQVSETAESNSMENLRVVVNAEGDTCKENDYYSAYCVVESAPKILVISGRNTNTSAFTAILNAAGCDYSVVSALNAPQDMEAMLAYKSIVLVDTYIDDLPIGFLENLETYVKDYGCGFVCCGGEESYALGGYRDTVLETVLPVNMELRNMNEMPSMAMVMVIDRSGSMSSPVGNSSVTNLDVAIKAATVAVDNLRDSDYVGILTFDDEFSWQVELVQASDRQAIKDKIEGIAEGGGTTIKPSLEEAYKVLSGAEASVKHVVLLTDGMGETTNFADVIQQYQTGGVTLSTVAVGTGSDTSLLERLATECSGRYYYSDLSTDIPKIFAREVFLGGDSFIRNGEFPLSVRTGHELAKGLFGEGWPILKGYVASSPKTASNTIISAGEKEDPILTVWQYGLGRTVAWNSMVTGEWDGVFAGKEDYVQLWKRVLDYSTGNADLGEDKVNIVTLSDATEITYEALSYTDASEVLATVIAPDGEVSDIKLTASAPGKFVASVSTEQTGVYHFNIRRMEAGEIQSFLTTAASVQFSDEYKFDVSSSAYLQFVDNYGNVLTEEDNIWSEKVTEKRGKRSIVTLLICIALGMFLLDVAFRRFQYEPKWRLKPKKTKKQESDLRKGLVVTGAEEATITEAVVTSGKAEKKTKKEKNTKKSKNTSQQTLDTSQLLKKKEERNL